MFRTPPCPRGIISKHLRRVFQRRRRGREGKIERKKGREKEEKEGEREGKKGNRKWKREEKLHYR